MKSTVKAIATAKDVLISIRKALHRSSTDDLHKIRIEIIAKKVILRGSVRSVAEKETAGIAAESAAGITGVDNQLLIEIPDYLF